MGGSGVYPKKITYVSSINCSKQISYFVNQTIPKKEKNKTKQNKNKEKQKVKI